MLAPLVRVHAPRKLLLRHSHNRSHRFREMGEFGIGRRWLHAVMIPLSVKGIENAFNTLFNCTLRDVIAGRYVRNSLLLKPPQPRCHEVAPSHYSYVLLYLTSPGFDVRMESR